MENKEIDNLKVEIRKLKRELELAKRKCNAEKSANKSLINANIKLATDNKYLKLDLDTERLKILSLKQYIESEPNLSVTSLKNILDDNTL